MRSMQVQVLPRSVGTAGITIPAGIVLTGAAGIAVTGKAAVELSGTNRPHVGLFLYRKRSYVICARQGRAKFASSQLQEDFS